MYVLNFKIFEFIFMFLRVSFIFTNINLCLCNSNDNINDNLVSTSTSTSTNIFLIGGLLVMGLCGYYLYKWYTKPNIPPINPQSPEVHKPNSVNIDSDSDIQTNLLNEEYPTVQNISTFDPSNYVTNNSPLRDIEFNSNYIVEDIPQIDYSNFDFTNFYMRLESVDIRLSDISTIFNFDLSGDINEIVTSYINTIYQILHFIDNNYIITSFRFFPADGLAELQIVLRNIFAINNSIKDLALQNVTSEDEAQRITSIFYNIEIDTYEILNKIIVLLDSGIF